MTLQDWRKITFQLSADLQQVQQACRAQGLSELGQDADALRARVEERRFTVAVVGDFRRGKSTFINALLGRAVLPSDIAPTTATINRVTYGLKPSAELRFWDGRPSIVIPVEELAEHVTKLTESAEARSRAIREALVSFPVRFCRNDVDILDTPGLGDEDTMTEVTLRQLPHVDAAILVIMATSPFSETEAQFLERLLSEGVTEILFVVSAMDRIRKLSDRERVVTSVRERVTERIRAVAERRFVLGSPEHAAFLARHGAPKVFGLSALDALEGRLEGESERVSGSGLVEFEAALEQFLTGADVVGLVRRLEQAERLTGKLADALRAGAGACSESASAELERCTALVGALEGVVEDQRRRSGDALARCGPAATDATTRAAAYLRTAANEDARRFEVTPFWPARYEEFTTIVATRVRASAEAVGMNLAGELFGLARKEQLEDPVEEGRILDAVRTVLAYVSDALSGVRGEPVVLAAPSELPGTDGLNAAALAAALAPPVAGVVEGLRAKQITDTLTLQGKKSAFDSLLSFDFGGIDGRWQGLATIVITSALDAHLKQNPADATVREHLDLWSRAVQLRYEPLRSALRAAALEIVATRERTKVWRERAAHERAALVRELEAQRLRLTAIQRQVAAHAL